MTPDSIAFFFLYSQVCAYSGEDALLVSKALCEQVSVSCAKCISEINMSMCVFRRRCGRYSASWVTVWPCESADQQDSRLSSAPWASVSLLALSLAVCVHV